MKNVQISQLGRSYSRLGFGCGSLGSRVNRKGGMAALHRAYEAGITWFDVAPSYGDGEAEGLLGDFLRARRDDVCIVTKVGIAAPRPSSILRTIKPAVQGIVTALPAARHAISRLRPAAVRQSITGDLIEHSLVASLKKLRTDRVDVLVLHEPDQSDLQRDDVLIALERAKRDGRARTIGVAGNLSVALTAARGDAFSFVQVANNPFEPNLVRVRAARSDVTVATHSVYGRGGAYDAMVEALRANASAVKAAVAAGYDADPRVAARALLLDFALAKNRDGVVLLSMIKSTHLEFALSRVRAAVSEDVMAPVLQHIGVLIAPGAR